jgi:pyruvate,water dikinase
VQNPARAGALFWLLLPFRIPFIIVKSVGFAVRLGRLSRSFADHFRSAILPAFASEAEREGREDRSHLSTPALLERLEFWIHRTLYDFARDGLKPTALAAIALGNVERWLKRALGPERATAAVGELTLGIQPDPEADFAGALRELTAGRLERSAFLERFGHRGPQEMELATPRWGEDHTALDRLVEQTRANAITTVAITEEERGQRWQRIATEAKLSSFQKAALEPEVRSLQTYLGLRETAKHYLMRGYALVRELLLELDRRFKLEGGIFFLTPDELPRLSAGEDLSGVIAQRKRRRAAALSLEVPPVLFSDDLEAIGRPVPAPEGADTLRGVPLSAGVAEGRALVLEQPSADRLPAEPYILVCPTTDPAWVPLFVQARGLVMETGGVLSHGAIVAREFGLPAVAGLPGIQQRLRTGQRLRVDGASGLVTLLPE